jgi:uncharacterized UPF0160 family protein
MAIALLEFFFLKEKYNLIRTRDKNIISKHQKSKNSFVIDVGFQYDSNNLNFDHHQNDSRLSWEDGTPFSSCGLIWKFLKDNKYLENKISSMKIMFLEEFVIKKIDKQDNGLDQWLDGVFISMYNRSQLDDRIMDKQFKKALSASKDYLSNLIFGSDTERHSFSFEDAGFITLLNLYLSHIEYKLTFDNNKVGISFTESDKIKNIDLFKEAVDFFDIQLLWEYLCKSKILNNYMNSEVAKKMKVELIDKAKTNNTNIAFVSMYQYNIKNNYATQFKKSLSIVSQFFLNTFYNVKNELKNKKEILKYIEKSKQYKDFVLCSSNIKESPSVISDNTNKVLVILPRTKNSWIIQAIPENSNNVFSKRFSMPKKWCGLSEEKLKKVSGQNNLIFCHKEGFMCMVNGSKEEVISFVKNVLIVN